VLVLASLNTGATQLAIETGEALHTYHCDQSYWLPHGISHEACHEDYQVLTKMLDQMISMAGSYLASFVLEGSRSGRQAWFCRGVSDGDTAINFPKRPHTRLHHNATSIIGRSVASSSI
jgi:hypothetical protein